MLHRAVHQQKEWRECAGLAVMMFVLSACALKSPPAHTDVVKDALPTGTQVRATWSAASNANGVTDNWLESFRDPRLDAVVAEATHNNLDLRQAAARVEVARQTVVVVGSSLWPLVGAQFGARATHATSDNEGKWFQSTLAYAAVSWELDVWGQLRAQRAASNAGFQATALDYAFARQSLAATTAKSWYLTIETRQLLALAEQSVATYSRLLELVRVRRDAGRVADLDVAEASANLNQAESDVRIAQGRYSEARRALELLLGRYPAAEIDVSTTFATLPPPVAAGLPSSLLERRPDVMSAEREVLAAFRTKEAARLALLPSLGLNLDGGRLSDRLLSLLHLNPWLLHSAVGMLVPIFEGGALRAQIKIATAEQEQSVAQFGAVALRAFGEVEVALTNEGLLAERAQFDQRVLEDRTSAVRIATTKYLAGTIDLLSVLILQTEQINAQARLIRLRNAQLANRINLHLVLGGSFDSAPAARP